VRIGEEIRDSVVITYQARNDAGEDTQEIENIDITNLEAVTVTIHSTGTEAVKFPPNGDAHVMDTQTPVTIDFGRDVRILGEPSAETIPKGRKVRVKLDTTTPGRVLMDRFLLNPKETVTISTFLTNFSKERPEVDWHIEDVRPPRQLKRDPSELFHRVDVLLNLSAVFLFVLVLAAWLATQGSLIDPLVIILVGGIVVMNLFRLLLPALIRRLS
jgi:hypothetical protein